MTIWITGSNGQLGSELRAVSMLFPQYSFKFLERSTLDLSQPYSVASLFLQEKPDILINGAAYTAVDRAEEERELAYQVNAHAPGQLAALCNTHGVRFLHISTDYVFDGAAHTPYEEDHPVAPLNVYGASKAAGESLVLHENPDAIIIRTSWVYAEYGRNFVKTMMRLMAEKETLSVVNDQVGSPTYAADLASAIMNIISSGKWAGGIYHYSNDAAISWFDFATAIAEITNSTCRLTPLATVDYPTPARRPLYTVMSKEKIRNTFGLQIRPWRERLEQCIQKLQQS